MADRSTEEKQTTITVATFNVWNSLVRFPEGVEAVAELIREHDVDIIGVQEVTESTLAAIATALGSPYKSCWSAGIISRLPVEATYHQQLRVYGTLLSLGPNLKIKFFNSHLKAYPYGPYIVRDGQSVEEVIKATEAAQVEEEGKGLRHGLERLIINSENQPDVPTVLVGDHNIPSHLDHTEAVANSAEYAKDRMCPVTPVAWPASSLLYQHGFFDSFRAANSDPLAVPGFTWTTGELHGFVRPTEIFDRIDFIYVHAGKSGHSVRVLSSHTVDTIRGHVWPSDHRAVVSRLAITPPSQRR